MLVRGSYSVKERKTLVAELSTLRRFLRTGAMLVEAFKFNGSIACVRHRWPYFSDLTASMAEMCLQFLGRWKATKTIAAEMLGILFVVARL